MLKSEISENLYHLFYYFIVQFLINLVMFLSLIGLVPSTGTLQKELCIRDILYFLDDTSREEGVLDASSTSSMLPAAHQSALTAHTGHTMLTTTALSHPSFFDASLTQQDGRCLFFSLLLLPVLLLSFLFDCCHDVSGVRVSLRL